MSKSLPSVVLLVIALTIISSVYAYLRAETLTATDQLEDKGLSVARRDTAVFYAGVAVVVGIIGFFVFRAMHNASPDSAQNQFLYLAIGIGAALEIMGAIVFKMRGLADLTVLHTLYIAAYGWLLPFVTPA
ncbi:MAG: hypothetical protein L0154_00145 [Chloroflexi bacterium]|nr:hypothetical protein [Chloroflexota bacterium]